MEQKKSQSLDICREIYSYGAFRVAIDYKRRVVIIGNDELHTITVGFDKVDEIASMAVAIKCELEWGRNANNEQQ